MAVNQTYVNNLATSIESRLLIMSYSFAVKANNSIKNQGIAKDITRLYSLLTILENYDVTETYFDNDFILLINREWKNYCEYKPTETQASSSQLPPTSLTLGVLTKERIYNKNSASLLTTDNASTAISVPETPLLYIHVQIDGHDMVIGNGVKTACDVWFSDDGGTSAKLITNISANDVMYYNAVIVGTSLLTTANVQLFII